MSWTLAIPLVTKVIERLFPDPEKQTEAKLKLFELQQSADIAELEAEVKLMTGQMEINSQEARSGNWFVAAWRPAVGWVCTVGLAWNFVLHPTLQWIMAIAGSDVKLPMSDLSTLLTILGAMLGIGGLRSVDKALRVDTKEIK